MYATERASRRVPSVKRGQRSVRLDDTAHNTSRASAGVVDMPSGVQSLNFSSSLDSTNAWEDVAAAAAHSRQASTVGAAAAAAAAAPTTPRTPRTPRRRTPSRGGGGGGVSRPHVALAHDDALDVLDRATRGREGRTDCWSHLYNAAQKAQQQREVANMQGRFVLEELDRQMTFTPNAQRRRGRSGSAGRSSRRTPGGAGAATTMMSSVNVWDKLSAPAPATPPPAAHPEELECRFTPKISEYARAKQSKQSVLQRLVPDPEVQHADRFEEPASRQSTTARREKSLYDVSAVHEKLFTKGDRHGQLSEREARRRAQEDKSMGPRVHLSHAQQEHVFQRLFDSSLPGGGAVDRDSPLAGIAERHQQQRTPARAAVLAVSPTSRRPAVDFNDALLLPLSLRDDEDEAAAAAALAEPHNKAAPHGAFTPLSVPSSLALASPAAPAPAVPVNVKQGHQPPPPVGGKGAGGPPTPSLSPLREPSTPPPVPPAAVAARQASKPGMKKAPSAHSTPCVTPRGGPSVKDPPSRGNSFSGLGGDVSGMSSLRLQQSVVAAAAAATAGGNAPIPFSPDDSDEFHSEEEDEADLGAAAPLLYRQASTAYSHASSVAPAAAAAEAAAAAPLRFKVGDAVLCSTAEGRVLGHVVKLWEGPNAYRVATEAGELHARNDTDAFVKSAGQRVSVEKRNGVVGIVYAGLSVADVGPGTPADGRIVRGSTLVAIDGTVVTTHDEVSAALAAAPATQPFDVYLHPPPLGREPAPLRTSKTPVMPPPGTPRMMKGPSSTPPGSRGSSPHGGPAFAKSPAAKGTLKGPAPKGSVKGPAGGGGGAVHATSTLPQNAASQRPPPLATGKLPVHIAGAAAANRPGSPTTPRRSPSPERGPSGGGGGGKKKVPRPRLKNK